MKVPLNFVSIHLANKTLLNTKIVSFSVLLDCDQKIQITIELFVFEAYLCLVLDIAMPTQTYWIDKDYVIKEQHRWLTPIWMVYVCGHQCIEWSTTQNCNCYWCRKLFSQAAVEQEVEKGPKKEMTKVGNQYERRKHISRLKHGKT